MIVEVVAIGTELLLGQITNRNAATIGIALAEHGLDAHYQVVVGDNMERMVAALTTAMSRSDAIIITGGIGPTQDDVTREAICAATGRPMLASEDYAQVLRERFAAFGREMPENNLRQAQYPEGAEMLPNPKGTAPGLFLRHEGVLIFALPGVPAEMTMLLTEQVLPRLRAEAGVTSVLVSRILRSWGRSESSVAELLDDLFTSLVNPTVAFLASSGEIKIRITAKADDPEAAHRLIAPVEAEVRDRLGSSIFGVDDDTIGSVLASLLTERAWTLGTAESATAGKVAAEITNLPGSSAYFRGGVVVYATDLKVGLLGVPRQLLNEHGVVSEATARAMARGAAELLDVDVAVSVTGSAGPDPQERTVGTIVVGVRTPEGEAARTLTLPGDRERVRAYATTAALHLTRLAIEGHWWST